MAGGEIPRRIGEDKVDETPLLLHKKSGPHNPTFKIPSAPSPFPPFAKILSSLTLTLSSLLGSMASLYATALRLPSPMKPNTLGACNLKLTSPVALRTAFRMRRSSCLEVCCAAKAETVERVAEIVKKTLALSEGTEVTAGSKFADLGADSLDTVEIVMAIEENFDVSVEEESSQNIATVQDVAELIEELVQKKAAAV